MIKKIIKNPKLIYIQWQDAHSTSGWHTKEQLEKVIAQEACIVEQVGWLVHEDDKSITIISRKLLWKLDNTSEFGMVQNIPKAWIKKRKVINLN